MDEATHATIENLHTKYLSIQSRWDEEESGQHLSACLWSPAYKQASADRRALIIQREFNGQAKLSRSLSLLLSETEKRHGDIKTLLQVLAYHLQMLREIRQRCLLEAAAALAIYKEECKQIDVSGITALESRISTEKGFFYNTTELGLKIKIAETKMLIEYERVKRDPILSAPDIHTDNHEKRDSLLSELDAATQTHKSSIMFLKAQIQQLRLSTGATTSWNKYHAKKKELDAMSNERLKRKLLDHRRTLQHNMKILECEIEALSRDCNL